MEVGGQKKGIGNQKRIKANKMEETEIEKNRVLLYDYLTANFVPSLTEAAKRDWLKWFTMYWRDELLYDELIDVCDISTEELMHRFGVFFKYEDLKWAMKKMKTRYFEFKSVRASGSTNYRVDKEKQELFKEEFGKLITEIMKKPIKRAIGFYYNEGTNRFFFVWQYDE